MSELDGRELLAEVAPWQSFVQRPTRGRKILGQSGYGLLRYSCWRDPFVFSVAVTAGSAAGGGAVSRGGAADGPLGDVRAKVAAASDVIIFSTLCNTTEHANARWR